MVRHFKPGDRVQLKSGGPIMEVIKYVNKGNLKQRVSDTKVLCVWYDKREGRKESVFHQNNLTKRRLPENLIPKHNTTYKRMSA